MEQIIRRRYTTILSCRPSCRPIRRERPWPVRLECTLDTARERGVTTIGSPDGELPLPTTTDELEKLKDELFDRHNRRLPGRHRPGGYDVGEEVILIEIDSLQPAGYGRLTVPSTTAFEVGLFWPCESDTPIRPYEEY